MHPRSCHKAEICASCTNNSEIPQITFFCHAIASRFEQSYDFRVNQIFKECNRDNVAIYLAQIITQNRISRAVMLSRLIGDTQPTRMLQLHWYTCGNNVFLNLEYAARRIQTLVIYEK